MIMHALWKKPIVPSLLSALLLIASPVLPVRPAHADSTLYYQIDGSTNAYFEAETYTSLAGNFRVVNDSARSNGKYMDTPNNSGDSTFNYVSYEIDVTNGGTFYVYLLSTGPDGSSDSFYTAVDNGSDKQVVTGSNGTWEWKKSSSISIPTGTHTLYVKVREDGARVDKIMLSKNGSLTPSGFGDSSLSPSYRGGSSDMQAPTAPTGLTASAVSSSQINLNWTASTDNVAVTGYDVYRGGTLLQTVTGTSVSDTGLSASTTYSYTIKAKDAAGNISAASNTATATTQASSGGGPLDPTKTPGGNFDLTHWKLTLPDSSASEKTPAQLEAGYTDSYFYTDPSDGAMTFWAPVNGGTTSGSSYPRSELRELLNPSDDNVNWTWQGTHILNATESVTQVPSTGKVIALQIHAFDGAPPLVKMQYVNGTIDFLVKQSASGGSDTHYIFSGINLGDTYTAQIKVVNGVLHMTVNGVTQTHDFVAVDPNWKNETFYFKAGAYTQDNSGPSTEGGKVKIYSLSVSHS